jgi:hypothetical protein
MAVCLKAHAKFGAYNCAPGFASRVLLEAMLVPCGARRFSSHTQHTTPGFYDPCKLAPGGRGCAKNPVRDLAAVVVLVKGGVSEALSDAGSQGREGRVNVMLVGVFLYTGELF